MATYAAWLKAKGLTSTRANAQRWKATRRGGGGAARTAAPQPAYDLGTQLRRDPLSVPFGSDIVWQGKGVPNLGTLDQRGLTGLQTIARPDGGFAVFGYPEDPTPQWGKDILSGITQRGRQEQTYAQGQVAPWLAQQTAALQGVQGQAQTGFANLIGQTTANLANAGAQAGVGGPQSAFAGLAPFTAADARADQGGIDAARAAQAGAAYQGAVDTLQGGSLAQGLTSALAQRIMAIPDKFEQQRMQFEQQLAPIRAQIESNRQQGEYQRQQALEQRRQFNASNAVEREIAGLNAKTDQAQIEADAAQAQYEAQQEQMQSDYRSVTQIRGDVGKGDALLDNQGQGFAGRPQITKFHGKRVQWEQAQNGKWYGIARSGRAGGGGGAGGDNIYTSSTTRKRLVDELTLRWNGDPQNVGGTGAVPGWKSLKEPGVADAAARQLALWAIGNRQFLTRNGKGFTDKDLRAFFQSVVPEIDYSRIRYYIDRNG